MDPLVELHPAAADADALLRARVAALLGADAAEVRIGRLCPRCGSDRHGRPSVRVAGRREGVSVSISRSAEHLVIAVSLGGGLGVDIERIADVEAGWDAGLGHPTTAG